MTNEQNREWLRTRRQLLKQIRLQVALLLGPQSPGLGEYSKSYKKEFAKTWKPSTRLRLLDRIEKSDVVLGADFHAFAQSQRTHIRILRELPKARPVILALECVESQYQESVDAFLRGELDESDFLEQVEWEEHWTFPWAHYKPLFDWAKSRGAQVLALNRYERTRSVSSLIRRDQHAARLIKQAKQQSPESLVYVVFGDLHLAQEHLPSELMAGPGALRQKGALLCLFQNVEELYFRLARRGLENEVEVLESTRDRFCILTSPPWVKWQSYLLYLESSYDRDIEEGDPVDFTDHLHSLVQFIAKDWKLDLRSDNFSVYGPADEGLWPKLEEHLQLPALGVAQYLMANDRSFYIPSLGLIYLSRETVNHAASLAGQYVHAQLNRATSWHWRQPQEFLPRLWVEAVGFFFSKMINHKRKSDSLRQLKAQLAASQPRDRGRESLMLALDQRMAEVVYVHSHRLRPRRFHPRNKGSFLEAARILGSMMGEKLFWAYRSHRLDRAKLLEFLEQDPGAEDFERFYLMLVKRLESQSTLPRWVGEG